jgi:hypothetical protein
MTARIILLLPLLKHHFRLVVFFQGLGVSSGNALQKKKKKKIGNWCMLCISTVPKNHPHRLHAVSNADREPIILSLVLCGHDTPSVVSFNIGHTKRDAYSSPR